MFLWPAGSKEFRGNGRKWVTIAKSIAGEQIDMCMGSE